MTLWFLIPASCLAIVLEVLCCDRAQKKGYKIGHELGYEKGYEAGRQSLDSWLMDVEREVKLEREKMWQEEE